MIGKRLKHYEVEEALGKGGMGEVYRARDTKLERSVAIKVLKQELTRDPDRRRRFLQEARAASAVTHPAIAQVYDIDEVDGVIFIAMEFVEGQTIRQLITQRELDLLGAVEVLLQVSEGLARAHAAGIVHRDIKSDNIMVTPDGHAKILDFGLAKLLDPAQPTGENTSQVQTIAAQTQIGTVLGTIAYMSPEQARGLPVDQRSDIFSLGIVLYEMATGELPFQGASALDTMHAIAFDEVQPVTVVRKNLPVDLHRIVSRCLRKRAEDRYPDAGALAAELKGLKRDIESGVQRPMPVGDRTQEAMEWVRNSMPQGWAGVGVAAGAVALILFLIFSQVEFSAVVVFGFVGLFLWRCVRNRRQRLIRRFVSRISRMKEVKAIRVVDDRISVFVDQAMAKTYIRVNSLVEVINGKLFFGDPATAEVRDDLSEAEFQQVLREPGIAFVRKDVLEGTA